MNGSDEKRGVTGAPKKSRPVMRFLALYSSLENGGLHGSTRGGWWQGNCLRASRLSGCGAGI